MTLRQLLQIALVAALVTIASSRAAHAAWPTTIGPGVDVAAGARQESIPDGAGGMLILSQGAATTVSHVMWTGDLDPLWPLGGVVITNTSQPVPLRGQSRMAPDGSGGAYVVWEVPRTLIHKRLLAQHVLPSGQIDPTWPATGVPIDTTSGEQRNASLCSDGTGGAFVAFEYGFAFPKVQHLVASGIDPTWTRDGSELLAGFFTQPRDVQIQATGRDSAMVVWTESLGPGQAVVFAQHVLASTRGADPAWFNGFDPIATFEFIPSDVESGPVLVSSGDGRLEVVWGGDVPDLGTHAVVVSAVWPFAPGGLCWGGCAIYTGAGSPTRFTPVPDDAGGLLVGWQDDLSREIVMKHLDHNGILDPQWPAPGVRLSTEPAPFTAARDGSGGAYVALARDFGTPGIPDPGIAAQRIAGDGLIDYAPPGLRITGESGPASSLTMLPDGRSGGLLSWSDAANGRTRAQRIASFERMGDPAGRLLTVTDTPSDQGLHLDVSWAASYLELAPYSFPVTYEVYTSPTDPAVGATWTLAATVPSQNLPLYSTSVTTAGDSAPGVPALTYVKVRTILDPPQMWDSRVGSGSSIADGAVLPPTNVSAEVGERSVLLSWKESASRNIVSYSVHRDVVAGFLPTADNFLDSVTLPSYEAPGGPGWYGIYAVDNLGRRSATTYLEVTGTTVVDDTPRTLSFARPSPSPATTSSVLRFALPSAQHVRLTLLDVSGRLVRTLADGEFAAGAGARSWDLRDVSGARVGAGLYFARLETTERTLVRELLVVR